VVAVVAVAVGLVLLVAVTFQASLGEVVLFAVLLAIMLVGGYLWFWVRLRALAVPALMLEPVGVFGAIGRAFALTRRQFWRTLGIALLTVLVTGIAAQVVGVPVGILAQVAIALAGAQYALVILTGTQALTQVISAAFVTPFTSSVTSLQYLDQRMRKEAYDVELLQQAGVTAS
jgi:hypothetical protein